MNRQVGKWLNCYENVSDGRKIYHKVFFVDDVLEASSGRKYSLGRFIHKGGNGTVYMCQDTEKHFLAAKFLHVLDDQRRWRFDFETHVLGELAHPNVLPCYDVGEVDTTSDKFSTPFMITELYQTNVARILEQYHKVEPRMALRFVLDICSALEYVHGLGIIHRDMKPGNLFVTRDDRLVVGDFGLAKTTTEEGADRFNRGDLTGDSETVGPLLWMSPELERYANDKSCPVDHRSDLFQTGMILWCMLTGERAKGVLDPDDDPTNGQCYAIATKLLQPKPEKRYQSAAELCQALQAVKI